MLGMPGPPSTKSSRKPLRTPFTSKRRRTFPPRPCSIVLRASSLVAVTIFVWSTRLKPIETAHARASCRTRTMSSVAFSSKVSSFTTSKTGSSEQFHAALDVQCRPHAAELEAELDERDRDRGTHAHDHGVGIEDARHGSQVVQHSADERIDELERRDVDENSLRPRLDDLLGEVLLQLH